MRWIKIGCSEGLRRPITKMTPEQTFIMKVELVQITVPKGNVTFLLVAFVYRDNQGKPS